MEKMPHRNVCRLCDRLIISDAVTYTAPNLIIDIPDGTYLNGEKYCIVVNQPIPAETTITAPVFISIGGVTTTLYPLNRCTGTQALASGIETRTKYSTRVVTNTTSGTFQLIGCINENRSGVLPSLP